jgi:hypothetical protein
LNPLRLTAADREINESPVRPPRRSERVLCAAAFALLVLQFGCIRTISSARAGELDGFDGRLESNNTDAKTYSWGLEYRELLPDHFNASFVWLNEGHLPNNHRDGQAVQLWWHSSKDPLGLVFEVGPALTGTTTPIPSNPTPIFTMHMGGEAWPAPPRTGISRTTGSPFCA